MKKILRISLVALFVATPMVASAAQGDRDAGLTKFSTGAVVPSTDFATTSYVNGSFKASADKIDLLIDDTAVATNGQYIDAGKSVSANLKELDNGLDALDTVVSNHATTLETLTGAGDGSISKQIQTAVNNVTGNAGDLDELTTEHNDSLVAAVNDVNATASGNAEEIQTINSKTISYVSDWSNPTVLTKKISELD